MTTLCIIVFSALTLIFSFIIMCFSGFTSDYTFGEKLFYFIFSLLPSIVISLAFFLIFWIIGEISKPIESEKQTTYNTEIKSIALKGNTSGSFVLGCGSISEKDYYYFITNGKYGYQISKEKIDENIYIKEDAGLHKTPNIEYIQKEKVYAYTKFFQLFFKNDRITTHENVAKIFHLPKGSIIQNYNVDINNIQ